MSPAPSGGVGGTVQFLLNGQPVQAAGTRWRSTFSRTLSTALATRIQQFNALIAAPPQNQIELHDRFTRLDAIEQLANEWMRDHNVTADETDRTAMFGLLDQVEVEHKELVRQQIQGGHQLWVKAGTSGMAAAEMQQRWQSISTNTGNIRVDHANGDHRLTMLAGMAKMLQVQHGRTMLRQLDTGNRGRVNIGSNWQGVLGAQPLHPWQPGSWAYPTASLTNAQDQSDRDGTGTGSYVQVDNAPSAPQTGPGEKPLHMPRYMTLAHELGHALHNQQGRARTPGTWDQPGDPTTMFARAMWSNPEEFQNITQNENALRRQSGLPERMYHKPPAVIARQKRKDALTARLVAAERAFGNDPSADALIDAANELRMSDEMRDATTETLNEYERLVTRVEKAAPWTRWKKIGVGAAVAGVGVAAAYLANRFKLFG